MLRLGSHRECHYLEDRRRFRSARSRSLVLDALLYKRLLASRGAMQEVIASSRSASRKKTTAIENLRAIPRVFS
jgi:hypothetical protein